MTIEIKVPELPESVADAVIANWYKRVGESINADEVLVDLETDKVILEVPTVRSGMVKEILFSVGDTVTAGQLLAVIDDAAHVTGSSENQAREKITVKADKASASMSPSVRKLIAENEIDATLLSGTGKSGRILKQDVEDYLARNAAEEKAPAAVAEKPKTPTAIYQPVSGERLERRVPMTRLRARIAERLLQSQQEAAILTTFNEVNMKPVMEIRSRYKDAFEKKFGVRLGFMSFFVQASVEALKRFPEVNASIDGNDIVYHGFYDVGVAVSGPNGLVVPIIHDADIQSIAEIEQSIINYANKARENKLALEDITGGTFTISNGGIFGSMLSTPIINPPQSAILGMHNITERAMVVEGEVTVLPMMYLALSYDHRLIDGKNAVQFLLTIKQLLEDPSRMLLGV
jgi:2-oxoglutarate dehydrogenase E2 component (dihydrolipoamide succinyltransferase)